MHNTKFCRYCRRMLITSDGKFKPCLSRSDNPVDFLGPLRNGASTWLPEVDYYRALTIPQFINSFVVTRVHERTPPRKMAQEAQAPASYSSFPIFMATNPASLWQSFLGFSKLSGFSVGAWKIVELASSILRFVFSSIASNCLKNKSLQLCRRCYPQSLSSYKNSPMDFL